MEQKILVIGELIDDELRNVSFEAIAAAKQIDDKAKIIALLLGHTELEQAAEAMISYGADRVITITNEKLAYYTPEGYSKAIQSVIEAENPDGIVMGHTAIGKDVTPKIASKLNLGLVSDVVAIDHEKDNVVFTRPVYSGKAFEKKIIIDGITFVTIRPNNIALLTKDKSRTGEIETKKIEITDLSTVIKDVIRKQDKGVDISEANIIVAGGRGVKSADGFDQLYELADLLGGAVGATRGAADAEYCDYSLQIGQTGKVVTPDLYIAVGISGAIQHLAGMSNAKVIVAINSDPDANIFNVADYGIVGDLFEVIPLLIEEIKQLA